MKCDVPVTLPAFVAKPGCRTANDHDPNLRPFGCATQGARAKAQGVTITLKPSSGLSATRELGPNSRPAPTRLRKRFEVVGAKRVAASKSMVTVSKMSSKAELLLNFVGSPLCGLIVSSQSARRWLREPRSGHRACMCRMSQCARASVARCQFSA
jgi:hypothetical protein